MEIARNRDKTYKINPALEVVGHDIYENKHLIRTRGTYDGVFKGRPTEIIKEERAKVLQDKAPFLKLYIDTNALALYTELSLGAQKLLLYIIKEKLEFEKDYIYLTLGTIPVSQGMSKATISTGFYELLDREWIFKSNVKYKFWFNINYISFGNREEMYKKFLETTIR